jgi:hypothetical protein
MNDIQIAEIPKNARERFNVAIRDFKGQRLVDLRVYASNGVDVVPTPKGVAIKPASLRAIIEALQSAEQAAKREGLI